MAIPPTADTSREPGRAASPRPGRRGNGAPSQGLPDGIDPGAAGRLPALLRHLSEGIVHISADGRVLECTPEGALLLGWRDPANVEGRSWDELAPELPLPECGRLPPGAAEWSITSPDGEHRVVLGRMRTLADGTALATLRDVSDVRELEHQLSEAQKMESLGRLTGGIAHDFRNLLTVIRGNAVLLLDETRADHPFRPRLEEMALAAERGGDLVAQLVAHARPGDREPRPTDLRAVVREIRPLVDRVVGDDVAVVLEEPDEPLGVVVDPVRMEQVILNLVTNARDAMPRGGRLLLRTDLRELAREDLAASGDLPPGSYARLSVADSGMGMSREVLDQIFEPFFTTKGPGRGTGLGLPSVLRIVQTSGGHVTAESEPGRGSAFHVLLPLAGPGEARHAEPAAPPGSLRVDRTGARAAPGRPADASDGGEPPTVLVVEDEPAIRTVLRQILERGGIRVLTAGHGEEALQLAESFQGRLDALLTDLNLPGMDGTEIARAVRALHPGVRVTIMSGYGPDAVEEEAMEGLEATFLQKPFPPESLVKLVRAMAGAEPAAAPPSGKEAP